MASLAELPDDFDGVPIEIKRDRHKRPLIKQTDGSERPYPRASSYVKGLENTWNLERWNERQALIGSVMRDDLRLKIAAAANLPDEKDRRDRLDELVEECKHQAGANAQADIGTELHKVFSFLDNGQELVGIPIAYMPGLAAYQSITRWLRFVSTETFGVCETSIQRFNYLASQPGQPVFDDYNVEIAGSWDRIVEFIMPSDPDAPVNDDGTLAVWPFPFHFGEVLGYRYVLDNKTNQTKRLAGSWTAWAGQTAIYSRCRKYYPDGTRESLGNVNQKRGLILHQPSGTGTATLFWIDLVEGWNLVGLATEVRGLGAKRAKLKKQILSLKPPPGGVWTDDNIYDAIQAGRSRNELTQLFYAAGGTEGGVWTDKHTEAVKARLKVLREIGR